MSETLKLLRNMHAKISSGWCQGVGAVNKQGFPVVPYSDDACQWCILGSMTAGVDKGIGVRESTRSYAIDIISKLLADRNEPPLPDMWNDKNGRTQAEVLELLDEAVDMAKLGGYE